MSLNNFTAGQPIRYSEGFNNFLLFSAGSGLANALPLPVITKFVPTEARRLHAEIKPDLVLAGWQQLGSVIRIVNCLVGQNFPVDGQTVHEL